MDCRRANNSEVAMSNSNGRIYIDTSVTPNIGISIADIQTVLRSSRKDIGGLITDGEINMWAKYKPIVNVSLSPHSNANWWKGADGNCGLVLRSAGNPATIAGIMDEDTVNEWTYTKPTGTIGVSPFRFLDFNGYYRLAEAPTGGISAPESVTAGTTVTVTLILQQDGASSLLLKDIQTASQCYLCLYVTHSGGSYIVTGDKCDGDTATASIDTTGWSNGIYQIYAMLSSAPIAQTSVYSGSATFYSLPYMGAKELRIGATPPVHTLSVYDARLEISPTVDFAFSLTNTTLGNTLKGVTVRLRDASKSYDDTLLSYESEKFVGMLQAQGGTFTYTGTITATQEILQSGVGMRLWVQFRYSGDGAQYTGYSDVAIPQD